MSRYINREEALSFPFANGQYDHKNADENFILGCESYKEWLENLQTEDVIPVVRCKDCKWWVREDDSPFGYCNACKHGHFSNHWEISIYRKYKADWYCAYGEKVTE